MRKCDFNKAWEYFFKFAAYFPTIFLLGSQYAPGAEEKIYDKKYFFVLFGKYV